AIEAERAAARATEARKQRELLEYLNAVLRHEVLNTANVVGGYAELIEEELTDPDLQERIETIQRQTEELTSVITDVRVLLSATEDDEDRTPMELASVLRETREAITDRFDDAVIEVDAPEGVRVAGDDMLHRLFSNLVANAVEHNDSDPPRVTIDCEVTASTVRVAIADNGPGIPAGMRDDLFDPVPDRDSDHGLGLTIVARLVDRYDGDITVTDTGPEGTTITVALPRVDD
ncbi:MAG: sensor histidine kinase, partial [Halobacteriaceae archaeon]